MGREIRLASVPPSLLEGIAKRVGEAVARGDFELARELIEEAARIEARTAWKA